MSVVHKQSCIDAFVAFEEKVREWEAKWPNCCTTCLGVGTVYESGDWVPYGSTNVQTPGWYELCNECLENGWCSRCGEKIFDPESYDFDNEGVTCLNCGWTEGEYQSQDMQHPRLTSHPTGEGPCECEEEFAAAAEEEYRQIFYGSSETF